MKKRILNPGEHLLVKRIKINRVITNCEASGYKYELGKYIQIPKGYRIIHFAPVTIQLNNNRTDVYVEIWLINYAKVEAEEVNNGLVSGTDFSQPGQVIETINDISEHSLRFIPRGI